MTGTYCCSDLDKGFRVLPTSWKDVGASRALIEQTLGLDPSRVLGHLFTMWSRQPTVSDWPPLAANAALVRQARRERR